MIPGIRKLCLITYLLIFLQLGISETPAEDFITPKEAINHVGEVQTVCGEVVTATYAIKSKGQPTFLNLDEPYPNQVFTALIWGTYRGNFESPPEKLYKGKDICVTGVISTYKGKAQIEIKEPSQISLR